MTSLEMEEAIQENLDRNDLPTTQQTRVRRWINQVIREDICNIHTFPWMERRYTINATAEEEFYAFEQQSRFKTCSFVKFRMSTDEDWRRLDNENELAFEDRYSTVVFGFPTGWRKGYQSSEKGFLVRDIPKEGSASGWIFQVKVSEYPAELVFTTSETNLLLEEWSKIIEILVTARGFLHYNQPNDYLAMQNVANIEINKLLTNERARDTTTPLTMRRSNVAGKPASGQRRGHWRRNHSPTNWT